MEPAARAAEARLIKAGIQLTLGGEPTFVPLEPEGAEWSITADGPTKLPIARRLGRELQLSAWPGSTLLYCPGKRYDGEVNPRWALRLITGLAGQPPVHWPNPCQPGLTGRQLAGDEGEAWLARLAELLGIELEPVPLRDPLDGERRVWAVPLSCDPDTASDPDDDSDPARRSIPWRPAAWPLDEALRELSGAPGPAGLRLPLEHMPESLPRQVLTLEIGADGWSCSCRPSPAARWKPCCRRWPTALLIWRRRGSAACCRWTPKATGRCSGSPPIRAFSRSICRSATAGPTITAG